jgi:uncharacterized protein (TIGR02996 family)
MQEGDLYPPDAAPPDSLGRTWPPPRLEWTPRDAAFIADIRANSEDDTPRLIYADWLEDQGDPRGLFIRLDIECLTERDPLRMRMLLRDRKRLLQRYERWWSPADKVVAIGGFSRGFLEAVTMTPEQVIAHGEEVFAREPVDELRLTTRPSPCRLVAIASSDCLQWVTRLRLEHCGNHIWLQQVLDSDQFVRLHTLTLLNWGTGGPPGLLDVGVLCLRTGLVPRLRTLRIPGLSAYEVDRLVDLHAGFYLERLEVPGWCEPAPSNPLDDEGPAVIHHESIGREGLEALARHPAAKSLRYLDASYNPVSLVLPEILASPHLANLETIRIGEREEIDVKKLRDKSG